MLVSGHKTKEEGKASRNKLTKMCDLVWNVGDGDGAGALGRRPGLGLGLLRPEKAANYSKDDVSRLLPFMEDLPP